jgi:hypothetical protein
LQIKKGKLRKIEHEKEIDELNSFIEIILEEDERSFLSSMYMSGLSLPFHNPWM